MPITFDGQEPNNIEYLGVQATRATLDGVVVWPVGGGNVFEFSDAGVVFQISSSGVVTLTTEVGSIDSATHLSGDRLLPVAVDSIISNTIVIRIPDDDIYSNANETVTGTVTALQTSSPVFSFNDAGVTCSVDTSGNVAIQTSIGAVSLRSGQPSTYGVVSSSTPRSILVNVSGVIPNGFVDAGQAFSLDGTCPTTQGAFVFPAFGFGNTGVVCSVNSQNGEVSVSSQVGDIFSFSPSSFSTIPTNSASRPRNISVTVIGTVPAGFSNSGSFFNVSGTCDTTQTPIQLSAFGANDWTGSVSVTPLGQILINRGNGISITNSPGSFNQNNTGNDRTQTVNISLTVPSGYSNSGNRISFNTFPVQPSNLATFTAADWSGVVTVTQSGAVTATVGNGSPITIITTSVPPNNNPGDTTVVISVDVTVPAGFRNIGSTVRLQRAAVQPGVGTPEFTNTVTLIDNTGSSANVTSGQVSLTAAPSQQDSASFTIVPIGNGASVRANQFSASSSNTTRASVVFRDDVFSLGTVTGLVSGTVGTADASVSITISGNGTPGIPPVSGIITSSESGTILRTGTLTVTASGGSGNYTRYSWSLLGGGLSLGVSSSNSISYQATGNGGGQIRVDITDSSGNTGSASFTYSSSVQF